MKCDRHENEDDDDDKRDHRTSKSRKHSSSEGTDERDGSSKKKNSVDRDSRKKSGGSIRACSGDEDPYDTRRDCSSKYARKSQEDQSDRRVGSGHPERESDSIVKSRTEESDRDSSRKGMAKPSSREDLQGKCRTRSDIDEEFDKLKDRNPRSRWDEREPVRKMDDNGNNDKADSVCRKSYDHKQGSGEKNLDEKIESGDCKSKRVDARHERGGTSSDKDGRRTVGEWTGRPETYEENNRVTSEEGGKDDKQRKIRDDAESTSHRRSSMVHEEKIEKMRQQRDSTHGASDEKENQERSVHADDDGNGKPRDKSGRELHRTSKRSRTPESSSRHRKESDEVERRLPGSENERNVPHKRKEREKDGYRDERSKGTGSFWDRYGDWEFSKDNWKKRPQSRNDKELRDADEDFEKEWDLHKHGRERTDTEKFHGRPDYRRERSRLSEGAKAPGFSNVNEHIERVEIRTKPPDYGREEPGSAYAGRSEAGLHHEFAPNAGDEDRGYGRDERSGRLDVHGHIDDKQDGYLDDFTMIDQNDIDSFGRSFDMQGERARGQRGAIYSNRAGGIISSFDASLQPFGNNQMLGCFHRTGQQSTKGGGRFVRGGRGRMTGRDAQRAGLPLSMIGPPISPLGLPPGPMQPMGPNMSPAPGAPMSPAVFVPSFHGPYVWPGGRGIDMNLLVVPPGLAPIPPPGLPGPRFPPGITAGPNPSMYFSQSGAARGFAPGLPNPAFSTAGVGGHGSPHDKTSGGWGLLRTSGPAGKAPSRGEQNDYSQNFVDTGMRPQNFIRELELTSTVEDYPKLRELIQKKDEIVAKSATPPMYFKCDLREFELSPESFGTKFDVILIDPPWEEYAHRAPGAADHVEYWTFEEIQNLKIEAVADTPSFIFLWVGDGAGLEQGRACLKKWGFRRCEDICWVKTNKTNATPGLRHDSHTLFQHSKEHCLMGIKGTVRRSTDGHIIHANIDTDIIIAEEPPYGSTTKPEDLYRIIEHFSLGRRRLELFGEDHNIRSGWLTVGKGLSSSNFNIEAYARHFADKDGKVWQGCGRNPPPEAPHLVMTTPEIESLRPKSPPAKNQQQQSASIQTTANSANKKSGINSPQTQNPFPMNQEASSNPSTTVPWVPPVIGFRGGPLEAGNFVPDRLLDGYGFGTTCGQTSKDQPGFDSHRAVNML